MLGKCRSRLCTPLNLAALQRRRMGKTGVEVVQARRKEGPGM